MKPVRALAMLGVALALLACRSSPATRPSDATEQLAGRGLGGQGVSHTVGPGQTLWRIAQTYGVAVQQLAEINDLDDPSKIRVGQTLWIPGATEVRIVAPAGGAPAGPPATDKPAADAMASSQKVETQKGRFIWPLDGTLFSRFGMRNGAPHDGIDISAPKGTPFVAVDAGEVLYSGAQRGYGNIILLKHADGLITIYAHNQENRVKAGARVRRGQVIGTVGQTGRASGPHLHFEVRENRAPRNPLFFLP